MDKEKLGCLIDAVYAIALTLLVLELPRPDPNIPLGSFLKELSSQIVDYVLSFVLLFSFWINQRRANDFAEVHSAGTLWLNSLALLLAGLIPYFTGLLSHYGDHLSVDAAFIINCLCIDSILNILLFHHRREIQKNQREQRLINKIWKRRMATTRLLVGVTIVSIFSPYTDRLLLFLMPLMHASEARHFILCAKLRKYSTHWARMRFRSRASG